MFQLYHLCNMDMSGDELLGSQHAILVPNSLSPAMYSTQLIQKLDLRIHHESKSETADPISNNTNVYGLFMRQIMYQMIQWCGGITRQMFNIRGRA